ncbi:MAG: ABC transporter ATP-binding protein [Opitutales bacterium]|jgi:ABC-type dipeptide/oligopeptide/nickel transport system ATPase component
MADQPLLRVRDLGVSFRSGGAESIASTGVNYDLAPGEILAVVGESGSGKSVSALALTRLLPPEPACSIRGSVQLEGTELVGLSEQALTRVRGKRIAYIFQEPGTSMNPVYTVGFQIAEAVRTHRPEVQDVNATVVDALAAVGIREPARAAASYPHELSGGMLQRAMIAMALACDPKVLVADEPTTALDVTIQKQIMELLARLRRERGMSILLITHNFGIVANMADNVMVMHQGRVVEQGSVKDVMGSPKHPYTRGLIGCIPRLGQRRRRLSTLEDAMRDSQNANR